MIRILLVDDQRVVVEGLRAILERDAAFEVVGEATAAPEALELAARFRPEVVTVDATLGGSSSAPLVRAIKARDQAVRVLALSSVLDEGFVEETIQSDVDGYLLKSASARELVQAIRLVAQGQVLYPSSVKRFLTGEAARGFAGQPLTDREREILRLIAAGATSREIARQLFLSSRTIDNHRARILDKLQVRNKAEAVAQAIRKGFIVPEKSDRQPPAILPFPAETARGRRKADQAAMQCSPAARYRADRRRDGVSDPGRGAAQPEAI